jgi:hypothetical protein
MTLKYKYNIIPMKIFYTYYNKYNIFFRCLNAYYKIFIIYI